MSDTFLGIPWFSIIPLLLLMVGFWAMVYVGIKRFLHGVRKGLLDEQ